MEEEQRENIIRRVQELENEIKEKEKELEEIRGNCTHPLQKVALKATRDTNSDSRLRKVCEVCGKVIGYPNQAEIQEYMEK